MMHTGEGFEFETTDVSDSDERGFHFGFEIDSVTIIDRQKVIDSIGYVAAMLFARDPEQWIADNLADEVLSDYESEEPDYSHLDQDADFCAGAWR